MPQTAFRPAGWSDTLGHPQGILVNLETMGACEFIQNALENRLIRVMITDGGKVLILPSFLWDEASRRKDHVWLKAPQPPRRRGNAMRRRPTIQG